MTDVKYLEKHGWKRIGQKRHKYGVISCWVPSSESPAAEDSRGWWTQGDALSEQRQIDSKGTRAEDNKTSGPECYSL